MEPLSIVQIILAVLLIAGILLQQSDASLGAVFGGGNEIGGGGRTRRGAELIIFNGTIGIAVLFTASVLISLFI